MNLACYYHTTFWLSCSGTGNTWATGTLY